KKGHQQAEELVKVLEPFPVSVIFSSPYLRCVQTVEPLARMRRIGIKSSASLEEGHGLAGLTEFLRDRGLDHAVLSTHGDIVWELVEDLVQRHVIKGGEERYAALMLARSKRHGDCLTPDSMPMLEEMVVTGAWWDYVDEIAGLAGDLLRKHPKQIRPRMRAWSTDVNMWKRRVSIICQLSFKR